MKAGVVDDGPPKVPVVFPGPNDLFSAVVATGGKFIPIRKPCDPSTSGFSQSECQEGMLNEQLENECAALANEGDTVTGSLLLSASELDSSGRLRCDPKCSSKREQIYRELEAILSTPPYVIVD